MMEWWTPQQAGLLGGLIGGGGGGVLIGGIGGGLCGTLAGKGLARRFVMSYITAMGVLFAGVLLVGLYALAIGQPYHVWYVLGLPGALGTFFGIGGIFMFRRRYAQHEQRTLAAEEFRRG